MKEFIEKIIAIKAKNYINDPDQMDSHLNGEKRVTEDYKGRELFELLQNADDELAPAKKKTIRISYKDNVLSVCNNGNPFSKAGVKSLMYSDLSPKRKDSLLEIGCKGLGFRSILGWTKEIIIDSDELHIKFSNEIALNQLKKYQRENYISGKKPPILEFPMWNEKSTKSDFTTKIELLIKNDKKVVNDINKQINGLDAELLLFLNNATRLEIETREGIRAFQKNYINDTKEYVELVEENKEIIKSKKKWIIVTKEGKCKDVDSNGRSCDRKYVVSIARKEDGTEPKKKVIYSYFPTNIRFNYPFLVHATFDLNSNRNNLINKEANKVIVKTIAELMVKLSEKMYPKKVNYERLWMLISRIDFPEDLIINGIEEALFSEIKKSRIFPNVNGKFIRATNDVIYDDNLYSLAKYVKGKEFENLLMYFDEDILNDTVSNYKKTDYDSFIESLEKFEFGKYYESNALKNKINVFTSSLKYCKNDLEKLSDIAYYIYYNYSLFVDDDCKEIKSNFINLLFDSNKKIVNCNKNYFIRPEGKMTNPPEFLRFDFIDNKYYEYLANLNDNDNGFLNWLNISNSNIDSIIAASNEEIENKLKNKEKAIECIYLMVKWLWFNRKALHECGSYQPIYLLTRNNDIKFSNELYYGKEYNNMLLENLFKVVKEDIFVCDIRELLGISNTNNKELINFLEDLNIVGLPRKKYDFIYSYDFDRELRTKYIETMLTTAKIKWPYSIPGKRYIFNSISIFCNELGRLKIPSTSVEYLDDILGKCKTDEILNWIDEDEEIRALVVDDSIDAAIDKMEKDNAFFYPNYGIGYEKMDNENWEPEEKLKNSLSFIKFKLLNTPWIEVYYNGKINRVKPSDCILKEDLGNVFYPELVGISINNILANNNKNNIKKYREVLFKLGVVEKIDRLPLNKIYSLLSMLHTKDPKAKHVPYIYNCIVNSDRFKENELSNCSKYRDFISNGFVYTNNGYKKTSDSFYQTNFGLCNQIRNKYNIIKIQSRLNYESVKIKFGVKKLSIKGKLEKDPTICNFNHIFQDEFRKFKIYAFCYRLDQIDNDSDIRSFCDLKITLCTNILANFDDDIVELDDYDYINESNNYYIKVPNIINMNNYRKNNRFAKAISDIVSSELYSSYVKTEAYQLLFSMDDEDRYNKVLEDTSDADIIVRSKEKLNFVGSTKEEFISILNKISKVPIENYRNYIERIDFDDLLSENNITNLIECFKASKVDLDDYNRMRPDIEISLIDYYKNIFENRKEIYRKKYEMSLYDRLKNSSINEKKKYREKILKFESPDFNFKNSINNDVDKVVYDYFDIDNGIEIDTNKIYYSNLKEWRSKQKNSDYIEDFCKEPEPHSLIYFKEFDELNKMYKKYIEKKQDDNNKFEIEYSNVKPIMKEYKLEAIDLPNSKRSSSSKSVGYINKSNKTNERVGRLAERIVYDYLRNKGINVIWVSENALKEGENSEGQAGKGYDMLIKENEKITYVEVKGSARDNEVYFVMSDNEYKFACEHSNNYAIYYVLKAKSNEPHIILIDNLFTKNGFKKSNNGLSIIENKEYTIISKCFLKDNSNGNNK